MVGQMDDVFETLEKIADRYPASIAIASHAGHTTYEHLVGNISSAASAAARNGIEAGQLVVLTGANPDVQFVLALALMRLGCRVGYNRDPALYEANGVVRAAVQN